MKIKTVLFWVISPLVLLSGVLLILVVVVCMLITGEKFEIGEK